MIAIDLPVGILTFPLASEAPSTHAPTPIHGRCQRLLSDLPSQGRLVRIKIFVRRFHCLLADCRQRIFVERLGGGVSSAVRAARFKGLVHHLDLAPSGRQGRASRGVCSCQ